MFFEKFLEEEVTPQESYSGSFIACFNNFFCHFPLGNDPYPMDELTATVGRYRKMSLLNDRDENSYKTDKYPKLLGLEEEDPVPVTRKEFYSDLFNTVEECGIKMEEVSKALNPLVHMGKMTENDWEIAFKTLVPIFTGMRKKGYSSHDLWG